MSAAGGGAAASWPAWRGELHLVDDVPAAFSATVAAAFGERTDERFRLALSGGPTARRCYERLAADHGGSGAGGGSGGGSGGGVDWGLVDVYMGDERCVPPDDPDANQRLVREALLDRVGPVGGFHPMSCDDGAAAYQAILALLPGFDLVHLGLGPDGHTASLFPGSPSLVVGPDTLVLETADPNERNPHRRMTLTLPELARAQRIVFTVSGAEKHDAFCRVRDGDDVPAVHVRAASIIWLVDHAAAGDA